MRVISVGFLLLLLGAASLGLAQTSDNTLTGNWIISILEEGQQISFWLLHLEKKDGKLEGSVASMWRVPPTQLVEAKQEGDLVKIKLQVEKGPLYTYEGRLPAKGEKYVLGSLQRTDQPFQMIPARLEPTKAKTPLDVERQIVTGPASDMRIFSAAMNLIEASAKEKSSAEEVKQWTRTVLKASEAYGPRWQLDQALALTNALLKLEGRAGLAVEAARSVEKIPAGTTSPDRRLRLETLLARALQADGKKDQAQQVEARLDKEEEKAFADFVKAGLPYKIDKQSAPQTKGSRTTLVELFTGAQCQPCVAANLAFEGLIESHPSSEAVFISYHLHVPGPDPMTNLASEKRADFYKDKGGLRGTPTFYINGKMGPDAGGDADMGVDNYNDYQKALAEASDKPAGANILLKAERQGDKIAISGNVSSLASTGPNIKLRVALAEDWVRYRGRNGLLYHYHVVRDMANRPEGIPLTRNDLPIFTEIDVPQLRTSLNQYLDNFIKEIAPFMDEQRPLRLRDFHVVAFVQNDETLEVLQAVQINISGK